VVVEPRPGIRGPTRLNLLTQVDINAPDFGVAFLGVNQNPTLAASGTPAASALTTNFYRPIRGYGAVNMTIPFGWNTYHSIQTSFNRRFTKGVSFGVNHTLSLKQTASITPRLQHDANGLYSIRADEAQAQALLGDASGPRHIVKANFVWQLPTIKSENATLRAIGLVVNDWQLSGVLTADSGSPYSVSFAYTGISNVNLTGSPNYGARVVLNPGVDLGKGCSSDVTRQFNTAAFSGPASGSLGLESSNNYLIGCKSAILDLAIARNIRLGGGRNVQLRAEMYNAPNTVVYTGRTTTMNIASLATPTVATNLPYTADGTLIPANIIPRTAGFGVVNNSNAGRTVQVTVRFGF
jgi:hypothetical protein